jgi:hypothetical protein
MGLEDIPKETHYELLKKGESSIRAKAQLIIDTMDKKRYYIITDEEKDEYPELVISLKLKGFTASKAQDFTGRTFIHLQEMTGADKAKVEKLR